MLPLLLLFLQVSPLAALVPDPVPAEERLLQATALVRLGDCAGALDRLVRLEPGEDEADLVLQARLLKARATLCLGQGEEALSLLEGTDVTGRPVLALLGTLYRAEAEALAGRTAEAENSFARALGREEAHALRERILSGGLRAAVAGGDPARIRWWTKQVARDGSLELSRQLNLRIAAQEALEESPKSLCLRLFQERPCAPLPDACSADVLLAALSPAERMERARGLFECWDYVEAAEEFETFLASPGYRRYHDRCHYYLAEIHARKLRDDRAKAYTHYEHVYKHGGGPRSYALYQMGRCQMNLEAYDKAQALFDQYVEQFPKGDYVERCTYYKGWLPYDHDELERALEGFDAYLSRYSRGDLRSYVLWFKAWSLFRLERYAEAIDPLERLVGYGNDIVAGKAWYWLGVVHGRLGNREASLKNYRQLLVRYPLSYYGMLAYQSLRDAGESVSNPLLREALPGHRFPLPGDWPRYVKPAMARSLRGLFDAVYQGELELARALYGRQERAFERAAGKHPAAGRYWLWTLLEEPEKLRAWGRKHYRQHGLIPDAENRLRWMLEYPPAYRTLLQAAEGRTGLPAWFYFSIMRQESRYRRGVISWADAMGLLQVIPSTGSKTAEALGVPFDRRDLPVPETNILLGTGYLGLLGDDFHHQLTLVAASYNAGPDPIRGFVRDNALLGWPGVIEEIAYNEARNYCRKVTGHVLKYLATYGSVAERESLLPLLFPPEPRFDVGSAVAF